MVLHAASLDIICVERLVYRNEGARMGAGGTVNVVAAK
jgi:hypothetical protein